MTAYCACEFTLPETSADASAAEYSGASSLLRPANFARPQAGLSRFSGIGKKHDLGPVHSRSGVAGATTKNPCAFVTPDHAVGKFFVRFAQCKAFAAQKA